MKSSFSPQAPSASSRVTSTGGFPSQARWSRRDTHDPLPLTSWTALTSPRPQRSCPCLCRHPLAGRSTGSAWRGRKSREPPEGGVTGETNVGIATGRARTWRRTFGQNARVRTELLIGGRRRSRPPRCSPPGRCCFPNNTKASLSCSRKTIPSPKTLCVDQSQANYGPGPHLGQSGFYPAC